jgi:hypothetical protein
MIYVLLVASMKLKYGARIISNEDELEFTLISE